ncbi:MAG: histidine phosphatase family protein [Chloroflexi bacterium]|nr:histidine phosphatase family protein [Chloroflexota bacterium]
MELCLVRHAIAEDRGPRWPDDSLRPLTAKGSERMAEAAAGLRQLFEPQLIVSSPYARALQTAEILVQAYGHKGLKISDSLATGEHGTLLRELERASGERVLVTGHEPYMSGLLSLLLTGDEDTIAATFKKGAAALVTFPGAAQAGAGTLEWLLQPNALRGVGQGSSSGAH